MRRTALLWLLPLLVACTPEPLEERPSEGRPSAERPSEASQEAGEVAVKGWQRAADFPLEPRDGAVVAWTGNEVVVVGGFIGPPCPPNADCVIPDKFAVDGAAYDPATDVWRDLTEAPIEIGGWAQGAYAAGQLFVTSSRYDPDAQRIVYRLVSYDVTNDEWRRWRTPPMKGRMPVADGDRIVFASDSDARGEIDDLVLDIATGEWSELPKDPIGPAFDRMLTATPYGLVLTAKELVDDPGALSPSLTRVALLDRETDRWRRLPDTAQIGGWSWTWTGQRLVSPEFGSADGGEIGNWGRHYPFGGRIRLPSGEWSRLPAAPASARYGAWSVEAAGKRWSATRGYVYDDLKGSWAKLPRPAGAPDTPGPGVWADDRLVFVGGTDWAGGGGLRSPGIWVYTP